MKKFVVAILSFLYLTTSTGASVQLHYCMDRLVGWDLQDTHGATCSHCGMVKNKAVKKGCCKDEQKQLKLHNDQKLTEASFNLIQLTSLAVPVGFGTYTCHPLPTVAQRFPVSHAPPNHNGVSPYLFNCVFRI